MFILNAGLSHKSKDWLMNSTTEILKIKKGEAKKRDVGAVQTRTLFGIWDISRVLDVQIISTSYTDW